LLKCCPPRPPTLIPVVPPRSVQTERTTQWLCD
jgi:hypothetical protein